MNNMIVLEYVWKSTWKLGYLKPSSSQLGIGPTFRSLTMNSYHSSVMHATNMDISPKVVPIMRPHRKRKKQNGSQRKNPNLPPSQGQIGNELTGGKAALPLLEIPQYPSLARNIMRTTSPLYARELREIKRLAQRMQKRALPRRKPQAPRNLVRTKEKSKKRKK